MNFSTVAIIAIICWCVVEVAKQFRLRQKPDLKAMEQVHEELKKLRARVATLEKIVTEDGYNLKKEFDNMD